MKHPSKSSPFSPLKRSRLSPYLLALLAFILIVTVLYGQTFSLIFGHPRPHTLGQPPDKINKPRLAFAVGETARDCDVFSGKWVKDDGSTRPLYQESECPYIQPQLTCKDHGRPDKDYQLWKWKPHRCALPRFLHHQTPPPPPPPCSLFFDIDLGSQKEIRFVGMVQRNVWICLWLWGVVVGSDGPCPFSGRFVMGNHDMMIQLLGCCMSFQILYPFMTPTESSGPDC